MKLSQRLMDERDYVATALGVEIICRTCRCTLATFADQCTAGLSDLCPGFRAIDAAKDRFWAARKELESKP